MKKRASFALIALITIIVLFHPGRHARYYDYVHVLDVLRELVTTASPNVEHNLNLCSMRFYEQLLRSGEEINSESIYTNQNFTTPANGGEYTPTDCQAIFKTAIIIPYRDRKEQLEIFLNYMHPFLQRQKIHYRMFIVEQNDNLPFNRAKMLNVGAMEALKLNFPCLILHDVDLFPLNPQNLYTCSKKPRHMSSSIDTFRFNLPYLGLFGGAIAIKAKDFQRINGMSNMFDGWGGEDDDFFQRLKTHDLVPYRFAPEISRYTMLFHKKEKASKDRWKKLKQALKRQLVDGLNSLPNNYKVVLEELYTHIFV